MNKTLIPSPKWDRLTFRRLCQDDINEKSKGPIYDCSMVGQWNIFINWKNNLCCSNNTELGGMQYCKDGKCAEDPLVEKIVKEQFTTIFKTEYGFNQPSHEPKGTFLMNKTLQEARNHSMPLDLFKNRVSIKKLHNSHRDERKSLWPKTQGCCKCKSHSLPWSFDKNDLTGGYPDDKHEEVQLTVTALENVELSVVVELLHGQYNADFDEYFNSENRIAMHIHRPKKFANFPLRSMWMAVVDKKTIDSIPIDLPLNLPMKTSAGDASFENLILLDRPIGNKSPKTNFVMDDDFYDTDPYDKNIDDDGRKRIPSTGTRDDPSSVHQSSVWWNTGDDTLLTVENDQQFSFIVLPWIPFFSNCDGYNSHISLSRPEMSSAILANERMEELVYSVIEERSFVPFEQS